MAKSPLSRFSAATLVWYAGGDGGQGFALFHFVMDDGFRLAIFSDGGSRLSWISIWSGLCAAQLGLDPGSYREMDENACGVHVSYWILTHSSGGPCCGDAEAVGHRVSRIAVMDRVAGKAARVGLRVFGGGVTAGEQWG